VSRWVAGLALACALSACSSPSPAPQRGSSITATPRPTASSTAAAPHVVDTIATGLDVPWGLAFLPDGTALVTERDSGRILAIADGQVREVGSFAGVSNPGPESGLLGIAVSPSYDEDRRIFVYLTTETDNRILRMTYDGRALADEQVILEGIPNGFIHDGGRLAFGPDGNLYASTGETGNGELAQDKGSLGGKILRITQDGDPAPGNPDPDSPIWSWGHRNVQGLAFDDDGRLWASEFGASTWDELNLIRKDGNYGWPIVEGNGGGNGGGNDFIDPQAVWSPAHNSPSGLAFREGYLWLGSLRGQRLWRIDVRSGTAKDPTDFFVGEYGRLRTVVVAPDGNLWVTTSNRDGRGDPRPGDDRILEIAAG